MKFTALTITSILSGFAIGFIIGQQTRSKIDANISTDVDGGVVTIRADLGRSLKQGIASLFE